jgi:hypothetical protein
MEGTKSPSKHCKNFIFEIVLLKRDDAVKEASFHLERKNEGVSQSPQEENSP